MEEKTDRQTWYNYYNLSDCGTLQNQKNIFYQFKDTF